MQSKTERPHEVPPSKELCSVEPSQLWAPGWPGPPPAFPITPSPRPVGAAASSWAAQKATLEAPRRTLLLRAGQRSHADSHLCCPRDSPASGCDSDHAHPPALPTTCRGRPAHVPPPRTPVSRTPLLFKFPAFLGARLKATETGLLFFFFLGLLFLRTAGKADPGTVVTRPAQPLRLWSPWSLCLPCAPPPPSVCRLAFLFSFRVARLSLLLFY